MRLNRVELFYTFLLHFVTKAMRRRGGHPRPAPMQGQPPTVRLRLRLAPKGGSRPQRDARNGAGGKAMPVSGGH
ncbi:hypothetical protein BHM03_00044112 [Ensete ventricosum]|nr:hypothetical protein BHM03_00044112 [Ensete ventricosum]